MPEMENAVVVDFPLRGEWMAPNTPGKKIPSHGTNQLGQRYAIDLLQVDWGKSGMHFFNASKLRYFLFGVPLDNCLCWGKEVHAPCEGRIIEALDGQRERKRVHLLSDLFIVFKNAITFNPKKEGIGDQNKSLQPVLGNYIIMECKNKVFAMFAHLQKDSIRVSANQEVIKGEVLGKVGHSGNSTAPHLHFQLMDTSDLLVAKGVLFVFREYELFKEGTWKTAYEEVPSDKDRIRYRL